MAKQKELAMTQKLEMTGEVYYHSLDGPASVYFDGELFQDGQKTIVRSTYLEEIFRQRICTPEPGKPGRVVRIIVELDD